MFDMLDITHWQGNRLRRIRPRMQMIVQGPQACLNPHQECVPGIDRKHRYNSPRFSFWCASRLFLAIEVRRLLR